MFRAHMSGFDIFCAAVWPAGVLLQLLSLRFVYWDTDEQAIQQHSFGRHKTIRFSEIMKVTAQAEWGPSPGRLKIRYAPSADNEKARRIYPAPADMNGFVDVLKTHAPAAAIEF